MNQVTSFYGKTPILKDISVDLEEGQCLCVLGRNGVGKTTLLRTIMGLTDRMTGEIRVANDDISRAPTHRRATYGLGLIPQGRQILANFTVRENILLGTFARRDGLRDVPELCLEPVSLSAGPTSTSARACCRAVSSSSSPSRARSRQTRASSSSTSRQRAFSPTSCTRSARPCCRLNREFGITLILTEQHIKVARKLGDAFLMMENGRIVARGAIAEMTDDLVHSAHDHLIFSKGGATCNPYQRRARPSANGSSTSTRPAWTR